MCVCVCVYVCVICVQGCACACVCAGVCVCACLCVCVTSVDNERICQVSQHSQSFGIDGLYSVTISVPLKT